VKPTPIPYTQHFSNYRFHSGQGPYKKIIMRYVLLFLLLSCCSFPFAADTNNGGGTGSDSALAKNLLRAASALVAIIQDKPVAIVRTRATTDADASLIAHAAYLSDATIDAILRQGLRGFDAEESRPLTINYQKGKLAGTLLFKEDDAHHWKEKQKAEFILQSTTSSSKAGIKLRWQLIELQKFSVKQTIDLPIIPEADIASKPDLQLLPKMNRTLLLFAGARIGEKIDRGECWDLPARVLKDHGVKVRGYNFGKSVPIEQALPGDVLTNDTNGNGHVMLLMRPTDTLIGALIYHQNTNKRLFIVPDTFPANMQAGIMVWRPGSGK
jgi:hypothetical protein